MRKEHARRALYIVFAASPIAGHNAFAHAQYKNRLFHQSHDLLNTQSIDALHCRLVHAIHAFLWSALRLFPVAHAP